MCHQSGLFVAASGSFLQQQGDADCVWPMADSIPGLRAIKSSCEHFSTLFSSSLAMATLHPFCPSVSSKTDSSNEWWWSVVCQTGRWRVWWSNGWWGLKWVLCYPFLSIYLICCNDPIPATLGWIPRVCCRSAAAFARLAWVSWDRPSIIKTHWDCQWLCTATDQHQHPSHGGLEASSI